MAFVRRPLARVPQAGEENLVARDVALAARGLLAFGVSMGFVSVIGVRAFSTEKPSSVNSRVAYSPSPTAT